MRVSTFFTSTCLISLLMANGANALFGPSTTDYLVRFQALRYLNEQQEIKTKLETQLKSTDAKATEATDAEKQLWEDKRKAAAESIKQVQQEKQEVLNQMKQAYQSKIKGLGDKVTAKQKELDDLNKPAEGLFSWFSSAPSDEDLNEKYTELSRLEQKLNKLKKDPPEFANVNVSEEMKLKIQAANHAIDEATLNLKNLGAQTHIRRLKTTAARLKGDIKRIETSMNCMITLAACKEVNNRESLAKGTTCIADNLKNAKIKATNAKCTALNDNSKWSEVDACIAEYRTDILKKSGTEGLSAKFRECRSLGL